MFLFMTVNDGFDLIDIRINDPLRGKGVMYIGQYGTSGYAVAARGYICDFIMRGIPLFWIPLKFDDSQMSDDNYYNILAKTAINRQISEYHSIILHCTADLWPAYKKENPEKFTKKNVIGYTVWETDTLPDKWPSFINESVNEVWVPSTYNKTTFQNSGVKIPIRVVPHIFLRSDLPNPEFITIKTCSGTLLKTEPNTFTFYNISELNERKNVIALVEAYCKAFSKNDNVRLILKVHYKNYNTENVTYCVSKINKTLSNYKNHAPVYILTRNLTELEMLALHRIGDCCVSLTRSEAFGLTLFDAMNYGKKVIVTGYGGQVDYLGKNYPGLVDYSMKDVENMKDVSHGYYMQGKQQWAEPSVDHCVELMKLVVKK